MIPRANETETKLETFHVMFKIYTSYYKNLYTILYIHGMLYGRYANKIN